MTTLELHPLCALFPRMSGTEFESLKADIAANGLNQPIVTHNGMVLDGGNRYAACVALGIEPVMKEYVGENLVTYVMSANFHRRHLSAGQMAAIVASAQDWAKAQPHGGDRKSDQVATLPLETIKARAEQSGASQRTQRMADKLAKASPDLSIQVAHGEISLPKALEKVAKKKAKRTLTLPPESVPTADDGLKESAHLIEELTTENDALRDRIAVEGMDCSEEEKTLAAQTIADLRAQVKTLSAELAAVKSARDGYMREAGEAKKDAIYWRKQAEKAAKVAA